MTTGRTTDADTPLAVVSWAGEGGPEVGVYGTPAGLRELAGRLTALADLDQRSLPDSACPPGEGVHRHVLLDPGPGPAGLTIGRLDAKGDGSTDWFLR